MTATRIDLLATVFAVGAAVGACAGEASDEAVCAEYCEVIERCQTGAECVVSCDYQLDLYGALGSCGPLYTELLQCIAGLDCAEFEAHKQGYLGVLDDYPCKAEASFGFGDGPCARDDPPAACVAYCDTSATCDQDDFDRCLGDCAWFLATGEASAEPGCAEAMTEVYTCYANAGDCDAFVDLDLCPDEQARAEALCSFVHSRSPSVVGEWRVGSR